MGAPWVGIRYHADTGFELRCEPCSAAGQARWWPLTLEFWDPGKGMTRCRACWNAYNRLYATGVRARSRRVIMQRPAMIARREAKRRAYKREWAARKRAQERAAEGRARYERRKVA